MSRYLYFIRSSSPPSVSSSMVKGGSTDSFKIVSFSTKISISPVGIFGFLEALSMTFPSTWMTNSRPKFLAFSKRSLEVLSSSKTN